MTYTVYFNEQRRGYYVRIRSRSSDIRLVVPRKLFRRAEVPDDEPTKRGEQIAQRWAAEEAERRAGEYGDALNLRRLLDLYAARNPNDVSAETLTRNGQYATHLIEHLTLPPSDIDIDAATDYRNKRAAEGARNRTIANELAYLKQVLTFGYESRRVTGMTELSLLRLPNVRKQAPLGIALTYDEVKLALTIPLDRNEVAIRRLLLFGVLTGHRLHPLRNFRREWIDADAQWQRVPAEMMKGERPYSAPICATAIETAGAGTGLAFPNRNGNAMKWPTDSVETIVRLSEKQVRSFSAHDLRRTFATWLYDIGVDKLTRSRLMGHSTGDVTDQYTRDSERQMREAVALLESEVVPRIVPKGGIFAPTLEGSKYPTRRARGDSKRLRRAAK